MKKNNKLLISLVLVLLAQNVISAIIPSKNVKGGPCEFFFAKQEAIRKHEEIIKSNVYEEEPNHCYLVVFPYETKKKAIIFKGSIKNKGVIGIWVKYHDGNEQADPSNKGYFKSILDYLKGKRKGSSNTQLPQIENTFRPRRSSVVRESDRESDNYRLPKIKSTGRLKYSSVVRDSDKESRNPKFNEAENILKPRQLSALRVPNKESRNSKPLKANTNLRPKHSSAPKETKREREIRKMEERWAYLTRKWIKRSTRSLKNAGYLKEKSKPRDDLRIENFIFSERDRPHAGAFVDIRDKPLTKRR